MRGRFVAEDAGHVLKSTVHGTGSDLSGRWNWFRFMREQASDGNLKRLRRYIADEAERLGKCGGVVVHRIELDDVEDEPCFPVPRLKHDALERDVDLLFRPVRRSTR